jgi:hypothetical protein
MDINGTFLHVPLVAQGKFVRGWRFYSLHVVAYVAAGNGCCVAVFVAWVCVLESVIVLTVRFISYVNRDDWYADSSAMLMQLLDHFEWFLPLIFFYLNCYCRCQWRSGSCRKLSRATTNTRPVWKKTRVQRLSNTKWRNSEGSSTILAFRVVQCHQQHR